MSVRQVVCTAGVPERERMDVWIEAVCETFLEVEVESSARSAFRGTMETHRVGPLTLSFMAADDQHIVRTNRSTGQMGRSEFHLIQARDRPLRCAQLGRTIELARGGCTLLDGRLPFTIENEADRDVLSVALPVDWLMTWLPSPEEAVVQQWQPHAEWGGVLAAALSNLTTRSMTTLPVLPSVFCDQLGALVALAAGGPQPPVRPRPALVDRLLETMQDSSRDAALCPAEVARNHGVSLRYLHLQFAARGTTFGGELLRIRLADAERMLSGAGGESLTVREVATRCGFGNASHFARRFRQRFGISPSEVRRRCKG